MAYVANNSRAQRPSLPKFRRTFPHLRCDSHTIFKVKKSKVKVTRPINADTHRAPYLPNAKAYTIFKLSVLMKDDDPHQPQAPCPPTSKVKVTMSRDQSRDSRSITKIGRTVPRDTCYVAHQFQGQKIKGQGHKPTNAGTQNVPYLPNGKA